MSATNSTSQNLTMPINSQMSGAGEIWLFISKRFLLASFLSAILVLFLSNQVYSSQSSNLNITPSGSVSAESDLNPLKQADNSSPRALIQDFLENINIIIKHFNGSELISTPEGYLAANRLVGMLDYRTTPERGSRSVTAQRLLMLYEILSRVGLPPLEDIPDAAAIHVDQSLISWTLPGTSITIQLEQDGLYAGKFLFSDTTVQNLPRYYRKIMHLPVRSGMTPGIYEQLLHIQNTSSRDRLIRNRLKPIETNSPRSILQGFTDSVNRAHVLVKAADMALRTKPPTMTIAQARETENVAENLLDRAAGTLDLSQVPKAIRGDVAIESVLQLKEIIDRVGLPLLDSVPDIEMIELVRKHHKEIGAGPVHWRLPDTTIELVEVTSGDREGKFLFSADTVANLNDMYNKIKDLPYVQFQALGTDYISPDTSDGFYLYYISSPGYLLPMASFLGAFIDLLPPELKKIYLGQTVWQWLMLVLTMTTVLAINGFLFQKVIRKRTQDSPAAKAWQRIMFNFFVIISSILLYHFLDRDVNLTGTVLTTIGTILHSISWLMLSTALFFAGTAFAEAIINSPTIDPEGVQASYIRSIFGVASFVGMAVVFVYGLSQVGVSLVPLLTSVGIGGLAIALAARPTIENIIGSFMIFLDKPFRVGQRVNIMGQNGTIEAIGLRSTKIRLLSGPLTSIPNKRIVDLDIENIGRRPYIRRILNVTITYDTTPEKIVRAMEILKEILAVPVETSLAVPGRVHPNQFINHPDHPPRVYFNELKADSLNIIVYYWYHPGEYWDYLEHANLINLQIIERFNLEGIDFAFPTQTMHLAGDDKKNVALGQSWLNQEDELSSSLLATKAALK